MPGTHDSRHLPHPPHSALRRSGRPFLCAFPTSRQVHSRCPVTRCPLATRAALRGHPSIRVKLLRRSAVSPPFLRLLHQRRPHGTRRLSQGRARRHEVVDEYDRPPTGKQQCSPRSHRQRARQIVQPLPGVEPRLIGHPTPLPQHGEHPRRRPGPPQLTRGGERDPPRRIMPPSPYRPTPRRDRHQEHRRTSILDASSPAGPYPNAPRPHSPPRRPTAVPTGLPKPRPHGPRQGRPERRRERQRAALLVGEQHCPRLVHVPHRRVHDRQPRRLRHRSHPARPGPAQDGTALRAERRARPPAASALSRQHQVGEVLPPPPHAHHCANTRGDRPPLWITPCGKLRPPHAGPIPGAEQAPAHRQTAFPATAEPDSRPPPAVSTTTPPDFHARKEAAAPNRSRTPAEAATTLAVPKPNAAPDTQGPAAGPSRSHPG